MEQEYEQRLLVPPGQAKRPSYVHGLLERPDPDQLRSYMDHLTDDSKGPRMELAVRWSHNSTYNDPCFLIADVTGHTFKYCRVTGVEGDHLQWQEISRTSRAPIFRAFDWSYKHNVVAVGAWSGEATVLHVDSSSPSLSLPLKSQRQCNSVALNSETLLGTGLEKIRNDFCLNVYDINHYIADQGSKGSSSSRQAVDPLRKLATSEGIVSIKFFPEQPNLLVAGVKGSCIRLYDLRENTGNPALQYSTPCVHNIAIDPCDQNYFASASSVKDSCVSIWDRRSTLRPTIGRPDAQPNDTPLLLLTDIFGSHKDELAPIWSLRYSVAERGVLGVQGGAGNLRIVRMVKDYYEGAEEQDPFVEELTVDRHDIIGQPKGRRESTSSRTSRSEDTFDDILAFDFMNINSLDHKKCVVTLRGNQDIGFCKLPGPPPVLAISSRNQIAITDNRLKSGGKALAIPGLAMFKPPEVGSISDALAAIEQKMSLVHLKDADKAAEEKLEPDDDGWNDKPEESAANQEQKAFGLLSEVAPRLNLEDVLLISDAWSRRAVEGYLFDAVKNMDIVKNDKNLISMWHWIGSARDNAADDKMVIDFVDFSYLGVSDIWHSQLGKHEGRIRSDTAEPNISTAIMNLVEELQLQSVKLPKTSKAAHRRLCLHVLGFRPQPLETVKAMVESHKGTEGALYAMMLDDYKVATTALRSGRRDQQNRALGNILQQYADGRSGTQLRTQIDAVLGDETNIFAKAIIAYICGKYWDEVVASPNLPPRYRAGMIIKAESDAELTEFITKQSRAAMQTGDVGSILYTGLGDDSVPLFSAYIEKCSDVQTAVLALCHVWPRYIRDRRIAKWRHIYREMLNSRRLFFKRAHFDMQGTELSIDWNGTRTLEPPAKQFTLACGNCQQALDRGYPSPLGPDAKPQNIFRNDGTQCPKCGAGLPRCVVCDFRLGQVNPNTPGGMWLDDSGKEDPWAKTLCTCFTCLHMSHNWCIRQWFSRGHKVCPAVGCDHNCNAEKPITPLG